MKNVISDIVPKRKGTLRGEWNDDELKRALRMFALWGFRLLCPMLKKSEFTCVRTKRIIRRGWKKQVCFVSGSDIDARTYKMAQMEGLNNLYRKRSSLS